MCQNRVVDCLLAQGEVTMQFRRRQIANVHIRLEFHAHQRVHHRVRSAPARSSRPTRTAALEVAQQQVSQLLGRRLGLFRCRHTGSVRRSMWRAHRRPRRRYRYTTFAIARSAHLMLGVSRTTSTAAAAGTSTGRRNASVGTSAAGEVAGAADPGWWRRVVCVRRVPLEFRDAKEVERERACESGGGRVRE